MNANSDQTNLKNEAESDPNKGSCWQHIRALLCCFLRVIQRLFCWLGKSFGNPDNLPLHLTALFTFLLVVFAYYAWNEATKGTKALQGQLTAIKSEQRPWIGVAVDVTPLKVGVQFKALIQFTNVGHSPASKVRSQVTPYSVKRGDPEPAPFTEFPNVPTGTRVSSAVLLPGPPATTTVVWDDEKGPSQADVEAVGSGALSFWLVGRVEYFDTEGTFHYTRFRGVFDPAIGRFIAIGDGNDAT